MKYLLLVLVFVSCRNAGSQRFDPVGDGEHGLFKTIGKYDSAFNERSYFYEKDSFMFRPYKSQAEVYSYLYKKEWRTNGLIVVIGDSSYKYEYVFRNDSMYLHNYTTDASKATTGTGISIRSSFHPCDTMYQDGRYVRMISHRGTKFQDTISYIGSIGDQIATVLTPREVTFNKTIDSLKHIIDSLEVGNHWETVRSPLYVVHTYYKNGKKRIDSIYIHE